MLTENITKQNKYAILLKLLENSNTKWNWSESRECIWPNAMEEWGKRTAL